MHVLLLTALALAHGPPEGTAVLRVQGASTTLRVTVDPRALGLDADGDGTVTGEELAAQRPGLLGRVDAAIDLVDGGGASGTPGMRDALLAGPRDDLLVSGHPALRLVRQWTWGDPPTALTLRWDGLDLASPVALTVARVRTDARGLAFRVGPDDRADAVLPVGASTWRVALPEEGPVSLASVAAPVASDSRRSTTAVLVGVLVVLAVLGVVRRVLTSAH